MSEKNIKIIANLDTEINNLEKVIKKAKTNNEIIKLNIKKKELLLQKIELEQM